MNKSTAFYFALIAFTSCIPAHALQISDTEEGEYEGEPISFTKFIRMDI